MEQEFQLNQKDPFRFYGINKQSSAAKRKEPSHADLVINFMDDIKQTEAFFECKENDLWLAEEPI